MKKLVGISVLALATALFSPVQSFAAVPKAGATGTKVGSTSIASGKTFTCIKSGKKMVWDKGVAVATAASGSNSNAEQINFFVATDQKTVHHLIANEGCANPTNSTAEVQVSVGNKWLAIKPIKSGWATSPACPVAQLGKKDSLAWVDAYLDPGVSYRWYFKGEVNIEHRDNLGNGYSASQTLPAPTPAQSAAPTPKTSAAPTPVTFKAPIPITLPVPQNGLITFSNILEHISDIPGTSYQRVQDVIAANAPVTVPTTVYVGPTTNIYVNGGLPRIQQILAREQQLWNGFSQTSLYAMYIYNAADEPAAEQKFTADFVAKGYNSKAAEYLNGPLRAIKGNCMQGVSPGQFTGPLTECRGANSGGYVDSNDSYLHLGQSAMSANDPNTSDGIVIAHEYNHAMQSSQWINSPLCSDPSGAGARSVCSRSSSANAGFSACWIFEGLPTAVGSAVAETSLAGYMNFRKGLPYGWGPTTITDYTQASLKDYLYNQSAPSCYQNGALYLLGYSVGALTTEALIAIGGPQSVLAIYSKGAEGEDFATAFRSVYGISWSEASTILSKVLAAEYANFGPPPK